MTSWHGVAWGARISRALAFVLALAVGCADSHAPGSDAGLGGTDAGPGPPDAPLADACSAGPVCHDSRSDCCFPSTCFGSGSWMCPLGTTPEATCTASPGACGIRSCGQPSDCVAVPESCCGTCGVATPEDVTAVRVEDADGYRASVCRDVGGCDFCAMPADPRLVATCGATSALCEPLDLGAPVWAGCTTDADCVLRLPACCACGPGGEPIALRADRLDELTAALCDTGTACLGCEPEFSPRVARCEAGTCAVR